MGILNPLRFSISGVLIVSFLGAILGSPEPLFGVTYLPGPAPVCYVFHTTWENYPPYPDRTKVGICEKVSCSIVGWQDTDIEVNDEGYQSPIQDGSSPGRVEWFVEPTGTVFPTVGRAVTYTVGENSNDTTESLFATVYDSGTKGLDAPVTKQVLFFVRVPNGAKALLSREIPIGTQGPPNNQIGAKCEFTIIVLPDDVNFSRVTVRENIIEQPFTWPDGTTFVRPAFIQPVPLITTMVLMDVRSQTWPTMMLAPAPTRPPV